MGDHDLRIGRVDSAGLDVAHAARLFEHVFEARNGRCAGSRSYSDSSDAANAIPDEIHRWLGTCFRRTSVSVRLHHDRVWRGVGISFADRVGDDAEDAGARVTDSRYRLWRDDYRDDG